MSQEAKPIVKCSVANCHYWGENNLCKADLIMIEVDGHAGKKFKEEYAGKASVQKNVIRLPCQPQPVATLLSRSPCEFYYAIHFAFGGAVYYGRS